MSHQDVLHRRVPHRLACPPGRLAASSQAPTRRWPRRCWRDRCHWHEYHRLSGQDWRPSRRQVARGLVSPMRAVPQGIRTMYAVLNPYPIRRDPTLIQVTDSQAVPRRNSADTPWMGHFPNTWYVSSLVSWTRYSAHN